MTAQQLRRADGAIMSHITADRSHLQLPVPQRASQLGQRRSWQLLAPLCVRESLAIQTGALRWRKLLKLIKQTVKCIGTDKTLQSECVWVLTTQMNSELNVVWIVAAKLPYSQARKRCVVSPQALLDLPANQVTQVTRVTQVAEQPPDLVVGVAQCQCRQISHKGASEGQPGCCGRIAKDPGMCCGSLLHQLCRLLPQMKSI